MTTTTALQNQLYKLSVNELAYYTKLIAMGLEGEEALSNVFNASAAGLLKKWNK